MEFAFNSEDLVLGASGEPDVCSLDNDIHPMWRRKKFRVADIEKEVRSLKRGDGSWDRHTKRLDRKFYRRMKPGLRLASLFLENSGPFFSQLLYGDLQFPEVKRLHPVGEVKQWKIRSVNVVGDPNSSRRVIGARLKAFADHVADSSRTYFPEELDTIGSWGISIVTSEERCRYAISIGSTLADCICQPVWDQMSALDRRYFNFQLAVTLVHELAHVAWRCRRWDEILQNPNTENDEAIMNPDEEQVELGQSWELWFFGGELLPIETSGSSPRWLGFSFAPMSIDTGNPESTDYPDSKFGGHSVKPECIDQFFQKERWAAHGDESAPFSIELTPLTSLTTNLWDSESIDDLFDDRMKHNHERQGDPRPSFPEE